MEEEDIYKEDGFFVIKKEINGEMIEFGRFSNLEEAIEERDELEEYGWPYLPTEPIDDEPIEDDYGKYISKRNDLFIVSRVIRGKEKIFGEFELLDDAKELKYRLIEHAWDDTFRNKIGTYGKFISKEGKKFVISRFIKGKYTRFGSYNTLDEALLAREDFIEDNWGVDGELNPLKKGYYGDHITYSFYNYWIHKTINGVEYEFGIFDNLENALIAENILIENDWDDSKIPEELYSWKYFATYNPRYNAYNVKNFINGFFIDFGLFPYENVKKAIKLLIENDWDTSYVPIDLYHKFSNIRYFYRRREEIFIVYRNINEEYVPYETFNNYNDAVLKRNKLFLSNWSLDEEFNKEEEIEQNIFSKWGLYFVKNEINGEIRLYEVCDNLFDAVTKRLECIKSNWSLFSIPDFSNNLSRSKYLNIPITLKEDSLGKHTLNLERKSVEELLPIIPHEYHSFIKISNQLCSCKLVVGLKLKFFENEQLQNYLEQLIYNNEKMVNISFNLQHDSYPKYNKKRILFNLDDINFDKKILCVPRNSFLDIVPFSNYEFLCNFNVNNINCYGKLILEFHIEILEDKFFVSSEFDSTISLILNSRGDNKLVCLDIFKAYNSLKNTSFNNMPLLSAINFSFLIDICEMFYKGYDINEIKKIFRIGPRQFNDYFKVAEYLDLLEKDYLNPKTITLTEKSIKIFSFNSINKRNYEIFKAMLEYKPFYDLFTLYLTTKKIPTRNDAFSIMKGYDFDAADVKIKTSANRLITWIEWIIENSYNFIM